MSPTNCPNCNAPVRGSECEYCGTVFGRLPQAETYVVKVKGIVDEKKARRIRDELSQQLVGSNVIVHDGSLSIWPSPANLNTR